MQIALSVGLNVKRNLYVVAHDKSATIHGFAPCHAKLLAVNRSGCFKCNFVALLGFTGTQIFAT